MRNRALGLIANDLRRHLGAGDNKRDNTLPEKAVKQSSSREDHQAKLAGSSSREDQPPYITMRVSRMCGKLPSRDLILRIDKRSVAHATHRRGNGGQPHIRQTSDAPVWMLAKLAKSRSVTRTELQILQSL